MENNNELNKKVIQKVRSKIVMSNLESEVNMKLSRKKQVLSLVAVVSIMFVGGFASVNAATDGKLAEEVKDSIKVVFNKKELEGEFSKDSNNHEIVEYRAEEDGAEFGLTVDKTTLDEERIEIEGTFDADKSESSITIKGK